MIHHIFIYGSVNYHELCRDLSALELQDSFIPHPVLFTIYYIEYI